MSFLSRGQVKWVAYALELFLIYIIQYTPGLVPSVLGVQPQLLLVFAMSIAIFDGEGAGMWYGLAAGLMMDLSSANVFGFYGLIIMLLCFSCGAMVVYLMRNNLIAYTVLCFAGLLLFGLYQWFFLYVIWGAKSMWFFLYSFVLPEILYSIIFTPIAYYFNRAVATHLTEDR